MQCNIERLSDRIEKLATISQSRLALTKPDKTGRDQFCNWIEEIGLIQFVDPVGNIFAIRPGESDRQIMIGSHLDTVKNAGRYDGVLGVLAGLEIAESLNENNIQTEKSLVIASFTNEEGIRYTPDMMGSLFYVGGITLDEIYQKQSIDSTMFRTDLESIGYCGKEKFEVDQIDAFIEFHIEQGPILENEQIDIGLVEGVQGIHWKQIKIVGVANHAGTTPMYLRKDAFKIANEFSNFINNLVDTVPNQLATIGRFEVKPNAINIVPSEILMTIDLRNPDVENLNDAIDRLNEFLLKKSKEFDIQFEDLVHFNPVKFSSDLVNEIELEIKKTNYSYRRMISGAGHDAQMLSRIVSSAMIFIPSRNGISHNPKEYSSPNQIQKGLDILTALILKKLKISDTIL